MCGRFTATFEFSDIRVRWNLDRDLPDYTPRYNVAPETSPNIAVIVRHRGANECRLMRWGLIPSWAKDPTIGNQTTNARVESLTEKPAFKHLLATRRCIIPADGFYEWRKEGKRKVPMWVHLKTKEPFAFAGLWDVWRKPDGKRVESFTITPRNLTNWCGRSTTACPSSCDRKTRKGGSMLLERLSLKLNPC
jgi:putative SOS response-associated peptidase YedK